MTTRLLTVAAALAVIIGVVSSWVAPNPPRLGDGQTGDPALAERVRGVAGERGYRACPSR